MGWSAGREGALMALHAAHTHLTSEMIIAVIPAYRAAWLFAGQPSTASLMAPRGDDHFDKAVSLVRHAP